MEHKYGMRNRGFSIGCQPMEGLVRREDDPLGVYWDILVYDRPLTAKEVLDYELDPLVNENLRKADIESAIAAGTAVAKKYGYLK